MADRDRATVVTALSLCDEARATYIRDPARFAHDFLAGGTIRLEFDELRIEWLTLAPIAVIDDLQSEGKVTEAEATEAKRRRDGGVPVGGRIR